MNQESDMAPSRIEMTRSGGFAGVQLHSVIDSAELSPEEAAEFEAELDKIDTSFLEALPAHKAGPPDRFQYDIVIEHGGKQYKLTIGERDMPASLGPLLNRMVEMARQRPV